LSFICHPKQGRGKFLPKKAIALGCKPGVHFKTLTSGVEVILEDGTSVKPEDVLEDTPASESFILNFIPDSSFIESVINNKDYEPFYEANISSNNHLALIYHSVDTYSVLQNP